MKCREKNSEKTFLKVENTETFWKELKKTNVNVVRVSESGITISQSMDTCFIGFGCYLLFANDGRTEACGGSEFNKRYEIIDAKTNISDEAVKELRECAKQFVNELEKIKDIIPKININFGDIKEMEDVDEMIKK